MNGIWITEWSSYRGLRCVTMLAMAALLVTGCVAVVKEAPSTVAETQSADWPASLHWSRNSAEHRGLFLQVYGRATQRLEELAAGRASGAWAVITDADETVLDNSAYELGLIQRGEEYTEASWLDYAHRRDAPPLPGARDFLERVHELGGMIVVVTNRQHEICDDTRINFRRMDLPFDLMLCRPPSGEDEKEPRFRAVQQGTASPKLPQLDVVLFLGDNIQDFPGLDQSLRFAERQAYENFGERFFLFPNPMYGSWQENPQE